VSGALALTVLTACQVDATVTIDVDADGSSVVTVVALLDDQAAAVLRGAGTDLVTDDLVAAGWTIEGLEQATDEPLAIVASKRAESAQRLGEVLDEIAGAGVFTNVSISAAEEFAAQRQSLALDVDLRDGWDIFGASSLIENSAIGQAVDGAPIDEVLSVVIEATVEVDDAGTPALRGLFVPRFDDVAPTEVRVATVADQPTARLLRWIAYALGFLFVLSVVLRLVRSRLERRADRLRKHAPSLALSARPGGGPSGGPSGGPLNPAAASSEPQGEIRLVVVEPLTVLYQQSDAPEKYLVPFVRHNGGDATDRVIAEALDQVRSGHIGTAELWRSTGVAGDPAEIDRVFVTMRWLRDDAVTLLENLVRRRLPIAAVSNDSAAWSAATRERDQLHTVWPWLVSSDLESAPPNADLFETLQRQSGVDLANCVYVGTDVTMLDIAAGLGMHTVYFRPEQDEAAVGASAHESHRSISDLTKLTRNEQTFPLS